MGSNLCNIVVVLCKMKLEFALYYLYLIKKVRIPGNTDETYT